MKINIIGSLILTIFSSQLGICQEKKVLEKWAIAIHGGAGGSASISDEKRKEYEKHLLIALNIGTEMLSRGESSLNTVQTVVVYLEDCPLFNAGKGAVLNINGIHELDAAIMDGSNLKAGAIAGVRDIKNPIKTARLVMDSTQHVLLIGEGASAFAKSHGEIIVENSYFSTKERVEQINSIKDQKEKPDPRGTVGCVALDNRGNLAAATSTGGMSGKKWGRVGDVPIIGAGTYANNNTVAVSGTGHGELWIRRVVAYDISALMEYKGLSLEQAAREVIFNKISPMGGSGGGVIAVDKFGNISMVFNTQMMHRAWAKASGDHGVGVLK
ncbi:MAG: isoaspartyl peptidase/L-asparaginase [Bacteroidales bacterium]|jgi:beta-aspartyl-peptidase (threonine type)